MLRPLLLAALALAAPLAASRARAQATAWSVRASAEAEALSGDRGTWQQQSVAAGATHARGALALEAGRVQRYGLADAYVAAEAYSQLAARTYGYARVRYAPGADVSPVLDAHAEVYRSVDGGLELGAGARTMQFAHAGVTMATALAALDRGPWRYAARGTFVPAQAAGGGDFALRRTFRNRRAFYAEAIVGAGSELLPRPGGEAVLTPTRTAQVRASVPLGRRAEAQAHAGITYESGFARRGGGLSVATRF